MSDSNASDRSGKKRALIWVLGGLGVLVGLIILAVVIAAIWIPSKSGRNYVSKRIEAYATSGMSGSLEIGTLYEIQLFQGLTGVRIMATDVRFIAPNGRDAIHAGDADVLLDVASILGGTIEIREATASLGTVTIERGDNGKLTIENTFAGKQESSDTESTGVNLQHMKARDMRVVLRPKPDKSYDVVGIDGTVFVTRPEGGEFVTTELVGVSGTLEEPKFLGNTLRFSKLKGRIASNQNPMVEMSVLLSLDKGTIDTDLSVEPDRKPQIKLRMSADGDAEVKLLTSAAKIGSFFGSNVSIETGSKKDDSN